MSTYTRITVPFRFNLLDTPINGAQLRHNLPRVPMHEPYRRMCQNDPMTGIHLKYLPEYPHWYMVK